MNWSAAPAHGKVRTTPTRPEPTVGGAADQGSSARSGKQGVLVGLEGLVLLILAGLLER